MAGCEGNLRDHSEIKLLDPLTPINKAFSVVVNKKGKCPLLEWLSPHLIRKPLLSTPINVLVLEEVLLSIQTSILDMAEAVEMPVEVEVVVQQEEAK